MARPSVRGKIVEAALETFQARGFNGCSVQDIVDAASVPKGSFYNHFKTKEALALEVLAIYRRGGFEVLAGDGARKGGKTKAPLERLRAHFDELRSKLAARDYACGCLMGTFASELSGETQELREAVQEGFREWSRAVAKVLREAQGDGSLRKGHDPALLARFVVNAWEGAAARAKLVRSPKPLDEFFAVVFASLLA